MKKTNLILLIALIFFMSCGNGNKEKDGGSDQTEMSETEKNNQRMFTFLNDHEIITEKTYEELFQIIVDDYQINRTNDKYQVIIHIAKKTLKEKDLAIKNEMYKNLKNEIFKLK